MEVLLDTNLLARCVQPGHPQHAVAVTATKELAARNDRLCLVPQVIYEYFVVCTRPQNEYGGFGMSTPTALSEVARVAAFFEIIPASPAIYPEWLRLLDRHQVVGKPAHDTRLVASINVHSLTAVATFNVRGFSRYSSLKILSPDDLAAAWTARSAVD